MPTYLNVSTANEQQKVHSGSAPVDPDSPLSAGMSSAATSVSEVRKTRLQLFELEHNKTNKIWADAQVICVFTGCTSHFVGIVM